MIISEKGINSAVLLIDPWDKTSNMYFEYPDSISITTHDEWN